MGAPGYEHPQPFHNPIRTYEYIPNNLENGPVPLYGPPLVYPPHPAYPMPVHMTPPQVDGLCDAYTPQHLAGQPVPHSVPVWNAGMLPPGYPTAVYPYAAMPPPWVAAHPPPGPHGSHWMGQSKWDAHVNEMHEAAQKAAAAKEATDKWKPSAEASDMFYCVYADGSDRILCSFATISSFKGKWQRGYDGIAYFVREKDKDDS